MPRFSINITTSMGRLFSTGIALNVSRVADVAVTEKRNKWLCHQSKKNTRPLGGAKQSRSTRCYASGAAWRGWVSFSILGSHTDCTSSTREEIEKPLHPKRHAESDTVAMDQLLGTVSARFQKYGASRMRRSSGLQSSSALCEG